jgi:hypothetical protein
MRKTGGIAALATVLVVLCAVVALEWYAHVAGGNAAPQPVQQISAASAAPSPAGSPTASPPPVVYVPKTSPLPVATSAPASPAAIPSPNAGPSSTPAPAPTPTPYATASQAIVEEPMVAATLAPHVSRVTPMREPADAPPRILSMSISTPVAHGGQVVSGTVQTTSNVASVEARIGGYSSVMQKVGVGKFVMSYKVPHLPFFLHRTYNIEVIARNSKGEAVRSSVPITIR